MKVTDITEALELLKLCDQIAERAHNGQTRWDGKTPYISHPRAVSELVHDDDVNCVCAALLHDVLEDTDVTVDDLRGNGIPAEIIVALSYLTHREGVTYADYIENCACNHIARVVKIADLKHNLSDLDGAKNKQRRDKYELALLYLQEISY